MIERIAGQLVPKDNVKSLPIVNEKASIFVSGIQTDFWRTLSEAYLNLIVSELKTAIFGKDVTDVQRLEALNLVKARLTVLGEPNAFVLAYTREHTVKT